MAMCGTVSRNVPVGWHELGHAEGLQRVADLVGRAIQALIELRPRLCQPDAARRALEQFGLIARLQRPDRPIHSTAQEPKG